ncbi:MAG: endo alpha-1,4 polygalactosaminidase [Deltaproteobacteria bacterium]|nr:endo alpha-1,4 polygalactosaminidase [Deltaproteobacteria bacterium]
MRLPQVPFALVALTVAGCSGSTTSTVSSSGSTASSSTSGSTTSSTAGGSTASSSTSSGTSGTSATSSSSGGGGTTATSISSGTSSGSTSTGSSGSSTTGSAWWRPGTGTLPWQWELDHEIDTTNAQDMGTGDTSYTGAPALAPVVYDIDGFDNSAADVAALHALGLKAICYIEVGALENYRSDASQFPSNVQGHAVSGYPSEHYLDITSPTVVSLIEARIDLCAQKGFDGVEPDIDDSYTDSTGFNITEAANVSYLATLSDYAHRLGLAWGLKNGGDGGTPTQFVADMIPHVDFAVIEEPFY